MKLILLSELEKVELFLALLIEGVSLLYYTFFPEQLQKTQRKVSFHLEVAKELNTEFFLANP